MATGTDKQPGSTDPRDLYANAQNLDLLLLGPQPFYPDRLGVQRYSWAGMEFDFNAAQSGRQIAFQQFLAGSGFEAPVSYAAGVTLERATQTFVRDNVQYRIKDPADLPYTLTGNWSNESGRFASMGDSGLRQELSAPTGADLIGYRGRNVFEVLDQAVNIKDAPYAVSGNNTAADRLNLIAALDHAASVGKPVVVPPGTYEFNDWIPLPDKLKMVFMPGAVWKLTANTPTLGGFLCGGYTPDVTLRPFTDVDIYGLDLDLSDLPGENAFNAVNGVGIRLYNPKLRNIKIGVQTQGGKAFQFEGAVVDGIQIYSPVIENATIGINSHADPKNGAEVARNISYFDVVMRNVDVPFNTGGQFADPDQGTTSNMNTTVYGAQLFNCGKLTYEGNSGPLGAGIVCGDRGFGLQINGLRVINTLEYGAIGALVRGTLFDVKISNFTFDGPEVANLIDLSPVTYGVASQGVHACRIDAQIQAMCKIGKIVKGFAHGKVGVCNFEVLIDSVKSQLEGITDPEAAFNALGMLNLSLRNADRQSTGLQNLNSLLVNGNSVSQCQPQNIEGAFVPADASGAGLALAVSDAYFYRQGRRTQVTFRVDFPSTASTAAAKIGSLPFLAFKNSGAVFPFKGAAALDSGLLRAGTRVIELFTSAGAAVTNQQLSGQSLYVTLEYLAV